ncbi:SLAP domain-containing protein [Companilactobacillus jidongensis]|uniref:SLAP domain-containing protein n=1 Tax=Companilactobacillus jidongensis TaxID=2486006 RepID=UPI000F7687F2|nr:SLAP domain-containing protein [Companilactobacillus jidongensis]
MKLKKTHRTQNNWILTSTMTLICGMILVGVSPDTVKAENTSAIVSDVSGSIPVAKTNADGPDIQQIIDNIDVDKITSISKELSVSMNNQIWSYGDTADEAASFFNLMSYGFDLSKGIGNTDGSSVVPYSELNGAGVFGTKPLLSDASTAYLTDNLIYIVMKISDQNGNLITNADDLQNVIDKKGSFKIDFNLNYFTSFEQGTDTGSTKMTFGTVAGPKNVHIINNYTDIKSADLQYPTEISVKDGTSVQDIQNVADGDVKLIDTDDSFKGDTVGIADNIQTDGTFYADAENAGFALDTDDVLKADPNYKSGTAKSIEIGNTFSSSKGKTYYRIVKVAMSPTALKFLNSYVDGMNLGTSNPVQLTVKDGDTYAGAVSRQYYLGNGYVQFVQKINVLSSGNGNGSGNSNGGGSSTTEPDREIDNIDQTSATYNDKPKVQIYDSEGNNIEGSFLNPGVNRHNDEKMILNGTTYYRVSTDQWVKASDVYVYVSDNAYVRVYNNNYGEIVNAHGKTLSRALKSSTDWVSDRTVNINGAKYYRVATNEFVKASSVYEYTYNSQVVTTTKAVTVYDERGNATTKQLPAESAYKSDRFVNINGKTYYRIATNEFVRADDINL